MKAVKIIGIVGASVLALSMIGGCAKKSEKGLLGRLTLSNVSESEYYAAAKESRDAFNSGREDHIGAVKYYDTLNSMLMALDSGEIRMVDVYTTISNYIVSRNARYVQHTREEDTTNFSFALRDADADLLAQFNKAISEMKADGTLKALTDTYITNLPTDVIPAAVPLPMNKDLPTIKIAVTGDLPPLDLVLTDGTPAGFNTAVLAEISKKIGVNFELVSVDAGARAAALASKRVDVVFWVVSINDNSKFNAGLKTALKGREIDMPDGIVATESYFTDTASFMRINK